MQEYWYVEQLADEQEARRLFQWYKQAGLATYLFSNTFMNDWLVACYADDDTHVLANREIGVQSYVDGYVGEERLTECFLYHKLLET